MLLIKTSPKKNQGFTLIEAMVALMILSIGMVGLAYLQATGMRLSSTSNTRTQAAILASDLMDRIRSHGIAKIEDFHDINVTFDGGAVSNDCDPLLTTTEAEITCWTESVQRSLTDPDVNVLVDEDVVTITMNWTEAKLRDETPDNDDDNTVQQSLSWNAQILDNR